MRLDPPGSKRASVSRVLHGPDGPGALPLYGPGAGGALARAAGKAAFPAPAVAGLFGVGPRPKASCLRSARSRRARGPWRSSVAGPRSCAAGSCRPCCHGSSYPSPSLRLEGVCGGRRGVPPRPRRSPRRRVPAARTRSFLVGERRGSARGQGRRGPGVPRADAGPASARLALAEGSAPRLPPWVWRRLAFWCL